MSIVISQDSSFKELSVSFSSKDIDRLKGLVKDMRVVKISVKNGELTLYQSYFKLVDVIIENEDKNPSLYNYVFTIRDTLNEQDYYLNVSFCDRIFFQKTNVIN